jgi:HD-GYP domain-containing protein (c-di-GMP phosphodiesterase class II)
MSKSSTVQSRPFQRWNLALIIGAIISSLIIALGAVITYFTYENQKKTALDNTNKIFEFSSQQIEGQLSALLNSIENFVVISSALEGLGGTSQDNRDILLPYLDKSFSALPWMEAFFVGYEDGSFYMIQDLRGNDVVREAVEAPAAAAYCIKVIPPEDADSIETVFVYYDDDLQILETRAIPSDGYDPRSREWYKNSIQLESVSITNPYLFFTSQEIGITTSHSLTGHSGVVGADAVLLSIARNIAEQKLSPSTEIALVDKNGLLFFSASEADVKMLQNSYLQPGGHSLYTKDLDSQVLNALFQESVAKRRDGGFLVEVEGEYWFGNARHLVDDNENGMYLLIAAPIEELVQNARLTRRRNLYALCFTVTVALLIGLYFSSRVAISLHRLSRQAQSVREFKLGTPITVSSRISEVSELADSMTVMQSAINRFVAIARALSAERNMGTVLEMIIKEAQSVTAADGGGIGLVSDDGKSFKYVLVRNEVTGVQYNEDTIPTPALPLGQKSCNNTSVEEMVITGTRSQVFDDISTTTVRCDFSQVETLHTAGSYRCQSLLLIPLCNRQDEVIGVLHLVNARKEAGGKVCTFSKDKVAYVTALASNAALALDNNRLIRAQKELFDSFVRLIAGAIDTKSPYTGGHCQRVPVLAEMLGDAASSSNAVPFKGFKLSQDERYELFVASWLHDCGKVTTPEYVVDKATKLETNYNRIHEIRTRFEVLWRDLDISYYKGLSGNDIDSDTLQQTRRQGQQQLKDDFEFIAQCNVGGEFMAPEKIIRLQGIAKKIWQRNFDNRIGLSGDEEARLNMDAPVSFPVQEELLVDRDEHIIERLDGGNPYGDNPLGITMAVPEYRYNLGELYNLSIAKGTLTEEERFKINDHIVQTIEMLNKLPFPKEIRRVPDWAGNHHEKLDGSGYPRSLTGKQLSIPERIMAVADIFEALTAADRPYKTPKKLSSCLKIMSFMRNDGHICPDLFELFLRSGLHITYAEKYMKEGQVDEVSIEDYL